MRKHGFVILILWAICAVVYAQMGEKRYIGGSQDYKIVYFGIDTNTSGGFDTNASGMQYDTIGPDSMKMPISLWDHAKIYYAFDIRPKQGLVQTGIDPRCTVWVQWFWGSDDTSRAFNGTGSAMIVTGIDSTYDSSLVWTAGLDIDSTMWLDWVAPRVIIGMHVWDDTDTIGAGVDGDEVWERQIPMKLEATMWLDEK